MTRLISINTWIVFLLLLVSCEPTENNPPIPQPSSELRDFSFLRQHNAGLTENVVLELREDTLFGTLPDGARVSEMIAYFELDEGFQAWVGEALQEPGVTENDFTSVVRYDIVGPERDTVTYHVQVDFVVKLPVIHLTTNNNEPVYTKEEYVNGTMTIDGMESFPDLETTAMEIRGRGHSTWGLHPKKPYQVKFPDKTPVLNMPEDKRWIFLAEYSDKTFLRNRTAFEMGYLSQLEWTPQCEYADVYLNGEYQGLYLITQKVEESKNRLDITDDGYLLEIDDESHLNSDDVYFYSDHFLINIKEPDLSANGFQYQYIKDYIHNFEDVLFSANFRHPQNGYRKFIDEHSVVDWFLINEIAKNVDAQWYSSIYLYLKPGEKLKMGPLWDFDLGFGNVNYADPEFPEGWWVRDNPWIDRMLDDPYFAGLVKERYSYFRQKQVYLFDFMDREAAYIYPSMLENEAVWHTMGVYVWPNPVVYATYEQEVSYLKSWITTRLGWLDSAIQGL